MKEKKFAVTVRYQDVDQKIEMTEGKNLMKALIDEGYFINSICGGKGTCGKCMVMINGEQRLACRSSVSDSMLVELPDECSISAAESLVQTHTFKKGCLVIDIGTTTLAFALVSSDGTVAEVVTENNPQRKFGADVISRIEACRGGKLNDMQKCLINVINAVIMRFGRKYSLDELFSIYVSGNMTMLHILFGIDCVSMGTSPYTPSFLNTVKKPAHEIGIKAGGDVISLPGIHAFAGADIVAGLCLIQKPDSGRCNILVDLGTNAEIALITHDGLICTSAAAGPCFEGGNISCGMSATPGAVDTFRIRDGVREYTTIEKKAAKGICGTGIIDVIAAMSDCGLLDKTGMIIGSDRFEVCKGIYVTQQDVREFQLAKSAVMSGIWALIKKADMSAEQIDRMYISGGFSSYINTENAAKIGLIPCGTERKCTLLNNSSLTGAIKFATTDTDAEKLAQTGKYFDLSEDEKFVQMFMDNMYF